MKYVGLSVVLVIGAGALAYLFSRSADVKELPEIMMALMIVGAITALMCVLFILAAGFSEMNLADAKQPLGLPEGSIRAMIALALILVFVVFGIFLFRIVGSGQFSFVGKFNALPDKAALGARAMTFEYDSTAKVYSVWAFTDISQDGLRLAQQLLTTVGTLVVAVAGFYFGSATANSAAGAATAAIQGALAIPGSGSETTIGSVVPAQGKSGATIEFELTGTGLQSPRSVFLSRGDEVMRAEEVKATGTKVNCKVKIDKPSGGKWDVVVENYEGKQIRTKDAFQISDA
jgi:hypothetical protein